MAEAAIQRPEDPARSNVAQIARRRYSADAAKLWQRWERYNEKMRSWLPQWQLLADHLDPNSTPITYQNISGGQKQTQRLFDSTAPHAVNIMTANIQGAVASQAQKFFSLAARDSEVNEAQGVKVWNEETADRTYLGYQNSNFVVQHAQMFKSLAVFCTGAILLEEGQRTRPGVFGGFRFKALPIGQYVIDEDADERVDLLYRMIKLSARAALARWGDAIGETTKNLASTQPEQEIEIIHAIYPREQRDAKKRDKGNMSYASVWFTVRDKHLIAEGGYHEFPAMVPRWSKNAGELFGRGPAWDALPDIRTLNRHIELYLGAGAKATDPPLLELYDSVIGPISLEPTAINTVKEKGALEALESKSRWEIAEKLSERLDRKIEQMFYVDMFDNVASGAPRTATEISIRNERTLRLLGPAGGRLHWEWLIPMVERSVALQARAGALEPPPQELMGPDSNIDVIAEGPLARAQRAGDLEAIERTYTLAGQMVQATGDASIWDNFDHDKAITESAEIAGFPADILRDDQAILAIRQGRAQQQAAAAKMQAIQQGAESLGKAAPGIKAMHDVTTQAGAANPPGPGQGVGAGQQPGQAA